MITLSTDSGSNLCAKRSGLIGELRSLGCRVLHMRDDAHNLQNSIATAWKHMADVDTVVRRVASFFTPKRLRVLIRMVAKLGGQAPPGCRRAVLTFQHHRQTTRWAESMHRDFVAVWRNYSFVVDALDEISTDKEHFDDKSARLEADQCRKWLQDASLVRLLAFGLDVLSILSGLQETMQSQGVTASVVPEMIRQTVDALKEMEKGPLRQQKWWTLREKYVADSSDGSVMTIPMDGEPDLDVEDVRTNTLHALIQDIETRFSHVFASAPPVAYSPDSHHGEDILHSLYRLMDRALWDEDAE